MTGMGAELTRRQNARARVLAALLAAGPRGCTNVELCQPHVGGLRAIGRVDELREQWDIETIRVGGGRYRYVLHGPRRASVESRPPAAPGWLF